MLEEKTIKAFLDELASGAPTPGGGSAAAVVGAMGAALLGMVCNLTVGKPAYRAVEEEMTALLARCEELRARLEGMVRADIEAFDRVMAAYRLPRGTEAERAFRRDTIERALRSATAVPLECAGTCADVIELAEAVASKGNRNVLTDAGVGVALAHAALRSVALNVYVNTAAIEDEEFAREQLEALDAIVRRAGERADAVYASVVRALQ